MLRFNPFKSMTVWGVVATIIGYLWQHFDASVVPPQYAVVVQVIGYVLSVFGIRNAVAKGPELRSGLPLTPGQVPPKGAVEDVAHAQYPRTRP